MSYKNLFFGILMMLISIIFILALLEATARITEAIKPGTFLKVTPRIYKLSHDSLLGIEILPNIDYSFEGYAIKTNSDGLRDREYSIQKPENVFRIIELGGSFTFGMGSNVDVIYVKQLEKKLNSLGKYEVINFGLFGANTVQEVELLIKKGLKYKPDLVILDYALDDASNAIHPIDSDLKFFIRSVNNFLLRKSVVYSYFRSVINAIKATQQADKFVANLNDEEKSKEDYLKYLSAIYSDDYMGWHSVNIALEQLSKLSEEYGFKVLVVFTPELRSFTMIDETLAYFALVEQISKSYGFDTLNLYYNLHDKDLDAISVSASDRHPNTIGHELIANAIYEKLINGSILTAKNGK